MGLCMLDRNLRYVSANQRLAEMHGMSVAQRLGRRFGEVFPDLVAQVEPCLYRALAGEVAPALELSCPNPQLPGELSNLVFSYRPARDCFGEIVGISVIATRSPYRFAPPESRLPCQMGV